MWGTTLIDGSADNQIYAVDVHTGNLVWETAVMDAKKRARASAGPIIANGKVITGRQCQPDAGNDACIVTAHDAKTGKEVWRTRTIPLPGEPGYETWGDVPMAERWHVGTWMVPSYDPETNLIFVGTSVTIPAPKFMLAGNDKTYLYHNSTLALNADTGTDRVALPARRRSLGSRPSLRAAAASRPRCRPIPRRCAWINPRLKPGERRKVVTGIPGKTGLVYTLDRRTGEFLWARPTVMQNVIKGIDGATGAVTVNPDALFTKLGETKLICPSAQGGKNWPAGAYDPRHERDVHADAEHVRQLHHDDRQAGPVEGVRSRLPHHHRAGRDQRRQRVGDFGRDRAHDVEVRAARGRAVAGGNRAAGWCWAAMPTAASARSTRAPAKCCGRPTSGRR